MENRLEETEYEEEEEYYEDDYISADKWRYSVYSAIVFVLISNQYTYILVNKLIGKNIKVSSTNGCPTMAGLFIHAAVFALIIRGMMELDI
jgi:hypothetical protein